MTPERPDAANARRPIRRASADAAWVRRRNVAFTIVCWLIIAGVALWAAAHVIHAILLVTIAWLLAFALSPAVAWLARWMPRWLALPLVYVLLLVLVATFGYMLVTATAAQITQLVAQARAWLSAGPNGAPSPLYQYLERFGFTKEQLDNFSQQALAQLQRFATDIVPVLQGVASGVLDTVLVIVLSIYLLIDGQRIERWARTGAPLRFRARVVSLVDTLQRVIGGYIRGQVALCALIGVLVGAGMFVFQLPYAALLGVLAFVLEFIPIIGTLVSGAVCVLIALTHGWLIALCVLVYFIIIHVIEGDVVGPRLVGHAVGLHPAVSIAALIAGSELFGLWGALLAAPLAGLIQAVLTDLWSEWRKAHPEEFATPDGAPAESLAKAAADALADPDADAFRTPEDGRERRPPRAPAPN